MVASDNSSATAAVTGEWPVLERALPAVLQIIFFLYPLVTTTAFEGFPCYEFTESGRGWLKADVTIECRTPEHDSELVFVWIAVFVYPIGIPALYAVLLFKERGTLADEVASSAAHASRRTSSRPPPGRTFRR